MRIPIRNKLIATYLFISLLTASLIYALTYFTSEQRVKALAQDYQLNEMRQEVYHWYAAEHQWEGFPEYFKTLHPPPSKPPESKPVPAMPGSKVHGLVTHENIALLKYLQFQPGDTIPKAYLANATPVKYKGETIAWIIPPDVMGISLNSEMQVFFDNILEVLFISICIGVLVSLFMGALLARILLKPVELLTRASSAIAKGKLEQTIPTYSDNEIGDLARSFNKMSQDLVVADKQRRQLTADITHDLGTPVQVISGYIEMAQDGEMELNSGSIDTIADELEHIKRLIKDMSLLAETDAKTLSLQMEETRINPVLERVKRLFTQPCDEKQITLNLNCADPLPLLNLDEQRVVQVLGNLISNALRYTPQGGTITLTSELKDNRVIVRVTDSGSGINPEDLPYIFDRFYRSDSSRGASGKMGLGLSISKGIIEMQGGTIYAESDGINGSQFIISFPPGRLDHG
ncbi:HAMP domain-containing histidine kinase [Vibrio sp. JC009]|uniref:sensor histidine kinase n=1 Tax=Vibrio sp. JC009 TaxID=2912314 RepID=UPI0023B14431|nr:HAMP domain-containing sensor histidine kinase [Vibrio sp. JC009]WED24495.1 HAMP domain-containing histidine kinase [Vibrio sp. JC009]